MSWPTPQDFVEAVQNPSSAFRDADLRCGVVATNQLGLPKVISGQFACVFKIESGPKTWAVRCFVRDFPDHQLRYLAISKTLAEPKLPYTVAFAFQVDGIRIRGHWYPIVKMEWLTGKLLGDYIAENVKAPDTLLDIQKQIASIHLGLSSRKIAHGDLQHGNIIVSAGKLYLIDYDGMYVPDLVGKGSHELGHRNYQHPFRTESDFNENIDVFSIWILCASLVALSIDPSLWTKLKGGDDNILFRADDYKEPYRSNAFAVLKSHGDHRIRGIANLLESLCYVTSLADVQIFASDRLCLSLPKVPPPGASTKVGTNIPNIPSWLGEDHARNADSRIIDKAGSWIVDHITIGRESFEPPLLKYRLAAAGLPISTLSFLGILIVPQTYSALFTAILSVLSVGIVAFLRNGFRLDSLIKKKTELESTRRLASIELKTANDNIASKQKLINNRRADFERTLEFIRVSSSTAVKQMEATKRQIAEELSLGKQQAHSRRLSIDSAEASECSSVSSSYTRQINEFRNQIATIDQGLQTQLASTLKTVQEAFVQNYLNGFPLHQASISGIGEKLTERLMRHGIRTAANATYQAAARVEGIGDQKAAALKRWRDGILQRAKNAMPAHLDANRDAQVRNVCEQQKNAIRGKISDLEQQRDAAISALRRTFEQQRNDLASQSSQAESECRRKTADADARGAREDAKFTQQVNYETLTFNKWIADAESDLRDARGKLAKRNYEYSLVEKTLEAYKFITFARWYRHQLGAS